jgi:hypothetical protein
MFLDQMTQGSMVPYIGEWKQDVLNDDSAMKNKKNIRMT